MRITKLITKGRNALLIDQVSSTHSSRQCKDTSVENLYLDTGDLRVNNLTSLLSSSYLTLNVGSSRVKRLIALENCARSF